MGRQIGFYFDEEDEKELLLQVRAARIAFLRRIVKGAANETYEEFHVNPGIRQSMAQTYICFESDLSVTKYLLIKPGGPYFIDTHVSPVIEFCRSGFKAELNLLISGRLWYQHKYWTRDENGNDIQLEKSEELKKLYERLAKWIKKYCKRLPNSNYIGPHAMKLYEEGAELSP